MDVGLIQDFSEDHPAVRSSTRYLILIIIIVTYLFVFDRTFFVLFFEWHFSFFLSDFFWLILDWSLSRISFWLSPLIWSQFDFSFLLFSIFRYGTPAYMCPQYNRTGRYDEKSEVRTWINPIYFILPLFHFIIILFCHWFV